MTVVCYDARIQKIWELVNMMMDKLSGYFKNMKATVFGGAGFIGSHLTEALVNAKSEVTVVDNLLSSKLDNLASVIDSIDFVRGDIRNPQIFDELGSVDIIFNEAAVSLVKSFRNPFLDLTTNVGGTINILEYSRKHNAKVIHASTGSVYGEPQYIPMDEKHPLNPISFYALSKLTSENYCKLFHDIYGVKVSILRYFNVFGPRQHIGEETGVIPIFVSRILQKQPLTIFGDGYQTRDFLHVDDCVNATLLAAANDASIGSCSNIGGMGVEVSIVDLAKLLMKLLDTTVPLIHSDPKPGDIQRLVADSEQANSLFGYRPMVSLESGLKSYVEFIQNL